MMRVDVHATGAMTNQNQVSSKICEGSAYICSPILWSFTKDMIVIELPKVSRQIDGNVIDIP